MTTITMTRTHHGASFTSTERPRLLTAAFVRLLGADLAAMTSFYLLLSVVPQYSTDRGTAGLGAGLTTGVLMCASVGAELVTPRVAALLDYRRLLAVGLVLLGAPALAVPLVSGLWWLMVICVVRGVGFAIVVVAVGALVTESIPSERRGEGLGLTGVASMVPAIVALPLGLWLVSVAGYPVVFVAGAVPALLAVVFVFGLPRGAGQADESLGIVAGLRNPAMMGPTALFGATAVASGVIVSFLPGAVADGDLAVAALFVQSAAATASRWMVGRHADRHGARGLIAPAVVLAGTGLACAALTESPAAVLAGVLILGIGFGTAQSASLHVMLERLPSSEYGTANAVWNMAYDLGWGAGSIVVGLVVASAGYSWAFALTAAAVLAVAPAARLIRR
jgi:MFS family permease